MMSKFRKLKLKQLIIMLPALMMLIMSASAQENLIQEKISEKSRECASPQIVSNESGTVFCVWEGTSDDRSRIFFREIQEDARGPEKIIDDTQWGNNTDPAITLDDKGNPHVVWTSVDEEGTHVHYAFRLEGQWVYPPLIRTSPDKNCEFPKIAVQHGLNRVFITWQEGRGSCYGIFCALQDKKGGFTVSRISDPDHQGYNLYPRVFASPTPFITWYGLGDSDFVLKASLLNLQTEQWMNYEPAGLENLPANRMPHIMSDPQGTLYAVWYDSDSSTDRIYFARQNDAGRGGGVVVDDNPDRMNSMPAGNPFGESGIALCWRGESIFGGQIFLTVGMADGESIDFMESMLLSDGQKLFYSQPDVTVLPGGHIAAVWVSNFSDGGDGAVYFRLYQLQ